MARNTLIELDYSANLLENYQKLAQLPGFVLLEGNSHDSRYDIVSAYPYKKIELAQTLAHTKTSLHKAFADLEAQLQPFDDSGIDLPFQGGAIGYVSYDFEAALMGIYSTPQESLKNLSLFSMGLYDWALITDHLLQKITLFAGNKDTNTSIIIKEVLARLRKPEIAPTKFILDANFAPIITKDEYEKGFNKIKQDLQKGRCYQVNYTQAFKARYHGSTWALYKQIRAQNPVPYSAFLHATHKDILSFSPERFLMHDKGHLLTSPIKGTQSRSTRKEEDFLLQQTLLNSSKNKAENVMIVDLMRNDLGKIAKPGSVKTTGLCVIQSHPKVHHLVSHIEAVLAKNISPLQAFMACLPGGSITGAPKLESMRIINELEPYARGLYCGNIAYFSRHGRFDSNIAIRTIIAGNGILDLAAGGAIVIDSICEEEYLECFTKIAAILNAITE